MMLDLPMAVTTVVRGSRVCYNDGCVYTEGEFKMSTDVRDTESSKQERRSVVAAHSHVVVAVEHGLSRGGELVAELPTCINSRRVPVPPLHAPNVVV